MMTREQLQYALIKASAKNLKQIAKNIKDGTVLSGNYWPRVYADQVLKHADTILEEIKDLTRTAGNQVKKN